MPEENARVVKEAVHYRANSETAAACARARRRDLVRLHFELVGQRFELGRLASGGVSERLREEPVREPRVARQQRTVQIGADRSTHATALEAALAVVAQAVDDTPERERSLVEPRPPGMILEPSERATCPVAVEQHIADHPALAGDRVEREEADAGELGTVALAVGTPEKLVAAAHGEHGRAARRRFQYRLRARSEVDRDKGLLAILAAADVEQVVCARPQHVAD